ncbi:Butyrophilin subfamily 3 member A1 [Triplophysa tibetana]|uniref:Butyrophilin subfamily 3 member A1 n=1 Tax=Triplophysa tibetana TaxID=1572043 RepID=A0A5A9NBJ3_9TELE|nr:Butyrophilin subfamily 3 member A1 [Triplophysa tibetana]
MAVSGEDVILPCSIKPNIGAVNMRVEWFRLRLKGSIVHLYEEHEDRNTNQLQSYTGRTQLFKEELEKGNTSLKLSRVQISDEALYKCFIQSESWYDDITVDVRVEAAGNAPVITVDGFDGSGGLHLQCESKGWNPEPELVWLDSEGVSLTSESTDTHRDDTDGFSVKHAITVYKSDTKYHCRVKLRHHMVETEIIISSKMFNSRKTLMILISVAVLFSVVAGILIALFIHKKRVLYQVLQNRKKTTQDDITIMRKYAAVNVTLDADSAHPHLTVSNNCKQVRFQDAQPNQEKEEDEEKNCKFDIRNCLLGTYKSKKQFYFEVHMGKLTDWDVGVARKSINRKGWIDLNPENGFWTVGVRFGTMYQACGNPHVPLTLYAKPQRVGVFVNCVEGRVSFYDVESWSHIFTFTGQSFNENLYPFFCLGFGESNAQGVMTLCNVF